MNMTDYQSFYFNIFHSFFFFSSSVGYYYFIGIDWYMGRYMSLYTALFLLEDVILRGYLVKEPTTERVRVGKNSG